MQVKVNYYTVPESSSLLEEEWQQLCHPQSTRFAISRHVCGLCTRLESMFSVTGLICKSRRSGLPPDKLHKICFLHDNFDFIDENVDTYDD